MDSTPPTRPNPAKFVGGALCLDFVNTVAWRGRDDRGVERLVDYPALVQWSAQAGILGHDAAEAALRAADRAPDQAGAVLAQAVDLREAIARLLQDRAAPGDVAVFNRLLARAPARTALVREGDRFAWPAAPADSLWQPLWPVLWSAADLLTGPARARVRCCADPECQWMFLDTSRSRPRLWCSMEDCGNRAKARRHYARRRPGGTDDPAMIAES